MRADDESVQRLRAVIEELAAADAPALVAEARAEARARVRSILTEAMAQAMLERARADLAPEIPPRPAPERPAARPAPDRPVVPPPPATGELGWYVYGISRADGPAIPELTGVAGDHDVAPLREGELSAIVSRVPLAEFEEERLREHLDDLSWVESTARRHEEVLDAVGALRTVVPMRLCTIYRDEAGVRAMLDRESVPLQEALTLLDGRSEWGVKVFAPDAEAPAAVGADAADPADPEEDLSSGTAYLAGRVRERRGRERAQESYTEACRSIHERLSRIAVQSVISAPQPREVSGRDREMVFNGVYLLEARSQEEFDRELALLQAEHAGLGLEIEPTGPWPAYNFVPGSIRAAS